MRNYKKSVLLSRSFHPLQTTFNVIYPAIGQHIFYKNILIKNTKNYTQHAQCAHISKVKILKWCHVVAPVKPCAKAAPTCQTVLSLYAKSREGRNIRVDTCVPMTVLPKLCYFTTMWSWISAYK